MEKFSKNRIFISPRALHIILIHTMSIFFICPAVLLFYDLIIEIIKNDQFSYKYIFILTILILILSLISFALYYFPQKYRPRLIIDYHKRVLNKFTKGQTNRTYDIKNIKQLTLKHDISFGHDYKLIIEMNDGSSTILLKEFSFFKERWEEFSHKVAEAIGCPLQIESLITDFSGKRTWISSKGYGAKLFNGLFTKEDCELENIFDMDGKRKSNKSK